jgi:hypothetical protein
MAAPGRREPLSTNRASMIIHRPRERACAQPTPKPGDVTPEMIDYRG